MCPSRLLSLESGVKAKEAPAARRWRSHEDPRAPEWDWDGHLLLLHSSEQERSAKLAAWVRRGLENDEKVIYTEAREGPEQGSLFAALRGNGVDAVAAAAEGRLSIIPTPEFTRPACGAFKSQGAKWVIGVSALGRGWPRNAGLVSGSLAMDDLIASTDVSYRLPPVGV